VSLNRIPEYLRNVEYYASLVGREDFIEAGDTYEHAGENEGGHESNQKSSATSLNDWLVSSFKA